MEVVRWSYLKTRASRANEFSKRGDVWSVGTDAARIHGQTQHLRLLDTKASVIKFREAVAFRRDQAVATRQIYGARRPVCAPRLSYDIEKLVPVSPIPHNSSRYPGKSLMHRNSFRSLTNSRPDHQSAWAGVLQILTPDVVESRV